MKLFFLCFPWLLFLGSCSLLQKTETPPPPQATESPEDTMMRAHCQMMPEMPGCEKYITPKTQSGTSLNSLILTDDATTIDVRPTETVTLHDGDTYDLTIQKVRKIVNGKTLIMLSYNGSIPGPTIRVEKGATVKFRVRNTVRELATTIHPHGIRLDYRYDGVPRDQGGAQDPVRVGDVYEQVIHFPDAGVMWYHPHTREDFEQELGEYGVFIVEDPTEKVTYDSSSVITLDDILLDSSGQIADFPLSTIDHTLMGRYGNTLFVNGATPPLIGEAGRGTTPDQTNPLFQLKQGEVRRLFLVNVANARPFDFSIPGVKMKLVGSDMGYYQQEQIVDHLIIAPAERYIVDIMSEKEGDFPIQSIGGGKVLLLGKFTITPSTQVSTHQKDFSTLSTHEILGGLSGALDSARSRTPDKSLSISMTMAGMGNMSHMSHAMGGMMGGNGVTDDGIEWEDTMSMMNAGSTDKSIQWILHDDQTGKEGMNIDWSFKRGSLVKIRITNSRDSMHPMQHPFHMHGQRFLILSDDGQVVTDLVWKDTVLIRAGHTVDILVDMSNPGIWMAHCHISEHLFAGMMLHYRVEE